MAMINGSDTIYQNTSPPAFPGSPPEEAPKDAEYRVGREIKFVIIYHEEFRISGGYTVGVSPIRRHVGFFSVNLAYSCHAPEGRMDTLKP
jgi:hypothetical protein